MTDNGNSSTTINFIIGFVIGSLIGAVVTLLFAPQSGEDSRKLIRDKSIEIKDRATEVSGEWVRITQEKADEFQKRGISLVEEKTPVSVTKSELEFDDNNLSSTLEDLG